MADRISKEQRSKNMAAVRSRGNKTTENKMVELFRQNRITGWRRHYKKQPGTPDFVFIREKVAIFVDGCFWHGCKKCFKMPKSNIDFWEEKIKINKLRDRKNNFLLKNKGWHVIRIWEHQLKLNSNAIIKKVSDKLAGPRK